MNVKYSGFLEGKLNALSHYKAVWINGILKLSGFTLIVLRGDFKKN